MLLDIALLPVGRGNVVVVEAVEDKLVDDVGTVWDVVDGVHGVELGIVDGHLLEKLSIFSRKTQTFGGPRS